MAINSLSASSHGFSGLVSGMDTQSMVESMLSGTKNKITLQQQKKAQLEYKQELYRAITTQLKTLQTSFFSFTNPTTNLMSSSFYSKMAAKTESKYFKATATSSARTGTSTVDYITQLAKSAKLTSSRGVSAKLRSKVMKEGGSDVDGSIDALLKAVKESPSRTPQIKLTIDSSEGSRSVILGENDAEKAKLRSLVGKSEIEVENVLNEMLQAKNLDVRVDYANGKLNFNSSSGEKLIMTTNNAAQALFGLAGTSVTGLGGKLTTNLDTNALLPSFQVEVDGQAKKTVHFDPQDTDGDGHISAEELATSINEAMDRTLGDVADVVVEEDTASGDKNLLFKLHNPNDNSRSFTITGTEDVMDVLGIKSGQSNKMTLGMRLDQINFGDSGQHLNLEGNEFRFSINGTHFNVTADTTLNSLITQINNSSANVKLTYNDSDDRFTLESTVSGEGVEIDLQQEQGNLLGALFGFKGNMAVAGKNMVTNPEIHGVLESNKVLNEDISSLKISGGTINLDVITADGLRRTVSVKVPSPDEDYGSDYYKTRTDLLRAMNEALESNEEADLANGVYFGVNDVSGAIYAETGAGTKMTISAPKGSLLDTLGFTNGQNNGATLDTKLSALGLAQSDGTIDLGIKKSDGTTIPLTFTDADGNTIAPADVTVKDLLKAFDDAGIKAEFDESDAKFRFLENGGENDYEITGTGAQYISDRRIKFEANDNASASSNFTHGQNAIASINGNKVERSSNDFTFEGVTYTLTQTFDGRDKDVNGNYVLQGVNYLADSEGYRRDTYGNYILSDGRYADDSGQIHNADGSVGTGSLTADELANLKQQVTGDESYVYNERAGDVETTRDTEQIYNGIVKFVEEYNKVMESIHSLLVEDPNYKEYLPLTDEQKSVMSDRDIELWEEKSKEGLLRGDSTLNRVWDDLRSTIYKKPSGSDLAIYNIGITTSGSTEYGGQLVIDYSKLQEMITSHPEEIREMFTNATDGVATALNAAIDRAAKGSSASANPGILVRMAGAAGTPDTNSSLYKQMKAIDDNLDNLFDKYDSEYNRYWNQFNAMEQMIQQMNQQSSWLAQQFSTGG